MSFHVNDNGEVKKCSAKSPETCKFSSEHFETKKEAQEYSDKVNRWHTDIQKALDETGDRNFQKYLDTDIYKLKAEVKKKELYALSDDELDYFNNYVNFVDIDLSRVQDDIRENENTTYRKMLKMLREDRYELYKIRYDIEDELNYRKIARTLDKDGFKMLNTKEEKELEETSLNIYKTFSDKEKDHLEGYCDLKYESINSYLRGQEDNFLDMTKPQIENYIESLDKISSQSMLTQNTKLFRGTDMTYFEDMKVGDTFESKSYFSTSTSCIEALNFLSDEEKDPCLLEINAPEGSICEYDGKTIRKMIEQGKVYKKDSEEDVYYYKDKECTQRIRGLFKSKKSKIIKYGTDIQEQPYMISNNNYF